MIQDWQASLIAEFEPVELAAQRGLRGAREHARMQQPRGGRAPNSVQLIQFRVRIGNNHKRKLLHAQFLNGIIRRLNDGDNGNAGALEIVVRGAQFLKVQPRERTPGKPKKHDKRLALVREISEPHGIAVHIRGRKPGRVLTGF